jgi:hypothetical protein
MPAAGRLHCIVSDRNLETLALVHSLCRWSAECGRLFVVYCRICGLNLALRRPPVSWVLNSLIRRWRKYTFGQTKQIQVAIINGSSLNRLGGQRFTSSSQAMKPWVYRVRTDAKYAILFLYSCEIFVNLRVASLLRQGQEQHLEASRRLEPRSHLDRQRRTGSRDPVRGNTALDSSDHQSASSSLSVSSRRRQGRDAAIAMLR